MTKETILSREENTDPLSYFVSVAEKPQLEQQKEKKEQDKRLFFGEGDSAYCNYIIGEEDVNIIARGECDDDSALNISQLEREVSDLKVQVANAIAAVNKEQMITRRLKTECFELRQDLHEVHKIQRLSSADLNGVLKRCLQNIIEDNIFLQKDIDALRGEVRQLQRKFWLHGVDPYLDYTIHDRIPGLNIDGSGKSSRRESAPPQTSEGTIDSAVETPLSEGIRRHSTGTTQERHQEYEEEIRKDGVVVASALLWD